MDGTISRALITGGAGQLATDLEASLGGVEVTRLDHEALDITDDAATKAALASSPDVVFNCAAFHAVDRCESEEDAAWATNVRAVKRLAEHCAQRGSKLVHFSTNYVFDGAAERPYTESDPPQPQSVYALTKLAGEHAAQAYAPGVLVVRTAGLYGLAGSAVKGGNFVQRILERAHAGEPIRMVADQRLTPTFTADLAVWLIDAVNRGAEGVLHLTNDGSCSWHEFTLAILERAGIDAPVEAVPTEPRPGIAARPLNGVLAIERARSIGIEPRRWDEALADYMDRAGFSAEPG